MKIGIITHYYNSVNYGGILQSYALCEFLKKQGVTAEQICYDSSKQKFSTIGKLKHSLRIIYNQIFYLSHPEIRKLIAIRKEAFSEFRDSIPHSAIVYDTDNIDSANDLYDCFITGSDQVWNPIAINRAYSLEFATKKKYSYAASIAAEYISEQKVEYYKKFTSELSMISVRENKAVELIQNGKPIEVVLDPVFLIGKEDWLKITAKRIVPEKYIFCYFLGGSNHAFEIAEYCSNNGEYKIVGIPNLSISYKECYGSGPDYFLSDIGPKEFLSLIYYADFVLTDSFHAICFSYIFQKKMAVVKRDSSISMHSRIDDILSTLELKKHFVNSKEEAKACMSDDVGMHHSEAFLHRRQISERYIEKMIEDMNSNES